MSTVLKLLLRALVGTDAPVYFVTGRWKEMPTAEQSDTYLSALMQSRDEARQRYKDLIATQLYVSVVLWEVSAAETANPTCIYLEDGKYQELMAWLVNERTTFRHELRCWCNQNGL